MTLTIKVVGEVRKMDYKNMNQEIWDKNVDNSDEWTRPVSSEVVEKARRGEWDIVLTPLKKVPKSWFPKSMIGKMVLCLASGGGQQGPIMAAIGGDVVVFDNSERQLQQDEMVANRDELTIETVQGNMQDLSMFEDQTFDLIVHPWSNAFVDDVLPVWKEAYRVLKKGGILIAGFANPVGYIFDYKNLCQGNFQVRHAIPYSDLTSISKEELQADILDQGEAVAFGHTLADQIGGQIDAGFVIAGFYEDIGGSALDRYMMSSIATKSLKL